MNSFVLLKKSSSLHASKRVALNALTHLFFSPSTSGEDKFISGNTQFNSFTTVSTANTSTNGNWVDRKFGVSVRGFHSGRYLRAGYAVANLPEDDEGLEISKLGISQEIVSALEKKGITKLFPIQRAVLEPAMQGSDMIGRARTGTGKTLAFGIPIMDKIIRFNEKHGRGRNPLALILAPTRELAKQVDKEFFESAPGLDTLCVYGGVPISRQMSSLDRGVDVVVGTPGRIIDLLKRGALNLAEIQFVVLDEADQMLNVGFAEDVETILENVPQKHQTLMFSATMPSWILKITNKFLKNPVHIDLVGDSDQKLADGISLFSIACDMHQKPAILGPLITEHAKGGKCIVFTQTKRDADKLSYVMQKSFNCEALHGDISQTQRERTLSGFRQGQFNVLVATDVAARLHFTIEMMNQSTHQKPHAILFPYPLQGHVIPFVNLAIKLASNGFTITFINTQSIHQQISKAGRSNVIDNENNDLFSCACKSGLDIRDVSIYDGFPVDYDRSLNHDKFFEAIMNDFVFHVDEVVGKLMLSNPSPNILIGDTFYVWSSTIAKKYSLVNVSYWTEPALVFSVYYHMDLLKQNGHYDCIENKREDIIDYIPGVKAIKPTDLPSYLQSDDTNMVVNRIIKRAFKEVQIVDFIICNTVHELEPEIITALQKYLSIYSIGPIFSPGFTNTSVSTSLWSESNCTDWLDTKPNGSVLYVSFGSYAHTNKETIVEIARGLVISEVNFIWILRPDIVSSEETDYLPIGYEESIKDRGLIVPWCCQTAVISHPAVGGFLTHCGWNSIMESIWCSVPFICFPLLTDQFTNRKLVVDDWKIGINLCDEGSISRDEVAEKVKFLMKGKEAEEIKQRIKKIKKELEDGLALNGSSQVNFSKFMDDLESKISKKNVLDVEFENQKLNHIAK